MGRIPAEIIGFFDAGGVGQRVAPSGFGNGTRPWVRRFGAGPRVNAFGYLIVELDAARALDRPHDGWRFVFGLRPGY